MRTRRLLTCILYTGKLQVGTFPTKRICERLTPPANSCGNAFSVLHTLEHVPGYPLVSVDTLFCVALASVDTLVASLDTLVCLDLAESDYAPPSSSSLILPPPAPPPPRRRRALRLL